MTRAERTWTAEVAEPADVSDTLRDLERACHGAGGWVRSPTATLVALVAADGVDAARRTLREVSDAEPVRVVLLAAGGAGGADVSVRRVECAGTSRSVSEVVVAVSTEPSAEAVHAAVAAARLPATPVVAWLGPDRPADVVVLAEVADQLIVDTTGLSGAEVDALLAATAQSAVVDLGWVALRPWRQLIAGLFAGPDFAAWLEQITGGAVHGSLGSRRLLGGWLLSRLQVPRAALDAGGGPTAVELHGRSGAGAAAFSVTSAGDDAVIASASVAGGPSHRRRLVVPPPSLAELLRLALAERASSAPWRAALAQSWGEA